MLNSEPAHDRTKVRHRTSAQVVIFRLMSVSRASEAVPTAPSSPDVDGPPYRWFGQGGARRRPRRTLARVLLALTTSTALVVIAALVGAAAILPPIGARRIARDAVQREFRSMLDSGETVLATAFAAERRWTDLWRESHGMLMATNQRLLYIGAPPTPLLRPRDDGPRELLIASYPIGMAFTLVPRARFRDLDRALVLTVAQREVAFLIGDDQWSAAQHVARAVSNARETAAPVADMLTKRPNGAVAPDTVPSRPPVK